MPERKTSRTECTASSPCQVCQGTHGCSMGQDGLIMCRRKEGNMDGFRYLGHAKGDSQWSLYRLADDPTLTPPPPPQFS